MFKKRNKESKKEAINLDQIHNQDQQPTTVKQKEESQNTIKRIQTDNQIGGTTKMRKIEAYQTQHNKFQSVNNKKEEQKEKVLVGDEAIETQTELAKRLYMQKVAMTKKIKEGKVDPKIYRGANNYANYKLSQAELQNPTEHYKWKHGPVRAKQLSAKNTCRFDYDPSLCKDWHDSGYCVFGNSCLYLHDRSNYKTGWELQKDFERAEKERWKRIINPDLVEQEDEEMKDLQKFKPVQMCQFCKSNLKTPVEVCCKHIFCLKCATKMQEKQKKCCICEKKLDGIMNSATKSLQKQKQQYEEMLKMVEKAKQFSAAKKNKYRDLNSLDVFTHKQ